MNSIKMMPSLIRRNLALLLVLLTVLPVGNADLAMGAGMWRPGDVAADSHPEVSPAEEVALAAGMALPPGFAVRTAVSGLRLPTDLAILPSGDLLIAEKGSGQGSAGMARVRLVRNGMLRSTPVITVSTSVQYDSGLASIILDPHFAHNGHFYLWYPTGEDALGWDGTPVSRLARFTFDPVTGRADPASETLILDNVLWDPIHNGGGIGFAADGTLFLATGDASTTLNPARNVAQNYRHLGGKVLRIRPQADGGYTVPADNPFADGQTQINDVTPLPEIYAAGLRNPFRMAQRLRDGEFFLADVGLTDWEEVNQVLPGVNYGWPVREGPCPFRRRGDECTPAPPEFTDPVLAYPRPANGGSLVGLAFYEGRTFPAEYRGRLFFADFNNRLLFTADLDAGGAYELFATDIGHIVDIEPTAHGLYLVDIYSGRILFLYYEGEGNQPPVPVFAATPTLGRPPLTVNFSAAGTSDPDDAVAFYRWSFGDGSAPITTTVPSASHVYTREGNHIATLQAVDMRGGESEILTHEITVYDGAMPVIVQHNPAQPERMTYQGGDTIRFTVQRTGDRQDLDPDTPYRWHIDLHHNDHTHPVVTDYAADDVMLEIPLESHDLDSLLWYRVHLTMLTADGIRVRVSHDLPPHLSTLQVVSWPGNAPLTVNQLPIRPLTPVEVVVGQYYELGTAPRILHAGRVADFRVWAVLDSWPIDPDLLGREVLLSRTPTIVAGAQPKIYAAFYTDVGAAQLLMLPLVFGATGP